MTRADVSSPAISKLTAIYIVITVVLLAAVTFRLAGIGRESLDGDEVFSLKAAELPIHSMIQTVRHDLVHPPLYYTLLHATIKLTGAHANNLRLLSLLAGIATVMLLVMTGQLYKPFRNPSLVAGYLLALNNQHIYYSQQVRSYSLYMLTLALLLVWGWFALERPRLTAVFWAAGTTLMTMALYLHYVAALYVASLSGAMLFSSIPRRRKAAVAGAVCVSGLAFVPWLICEIPVFAARKGLDQNLAWMGTPSVYDLKAIWGNYIGVPPFPGGTSAVLLIALVLIGSGVYLERRHSATVSFPILATLLATSFLPPAITFLVSYGPPHLPIFGARHVLPSMFSFLLLLTFSIFRIGTHLNLQLSGLTALAGIFLLLQVRPAVEAIMKLPRRIPFDEIARQVPSGPPVYTTNSYGLGETIRIASKGQVTPTSLPRVDEVPPQFTLIFRPDVAWEQKKLIALTSAGYRITTLYRSSGVVIGTVKARGER